MNINDVVIGNRTRKASTVQRRDVLQNELSRVGLRLVVKANDSPAFGKETFRPAPKTAKQINR